MVSAIWLHFIDIFDRVLAIFAWTIVLCVVVNSTSGWDSKAPLTKFSTVLESL
jgi:hypothetical protein